MAKDMRSFIKKLETDYPEEIIRIQNGPLDLAEGECVALLHHLMKLGKRPMAIFEHVRDLRGERWPGSVAFQLAGTWSKVGVAYGQSPQRTSLLDVQSETERRINDPIKPIVISTSEAPVKAQLRSGKGDFLALPGYRAAEKDHRPGNLSGIMVIRDPDSKRYNLSWHMNHIVGAENSALTLSGGDAHNWQIISKYKERGEDWVPVAQIFGHNVLFGLAATVRCGLDLDEYALAGGILGEPLRLTPSETWGEDLLIPADAMRIQTKLQLKLLEGST